MPAPMRLSLPADVTVDVLVVGAGACGLIAALRAAQSGAQVAVLERLDRLAGNTALSTGSIPAAGTRLQAAAGIADDAATMIADMTRVAGEHDASHLTRVLARRSAEVVDWLVDACGVPLKLYTSYRHVGHSVSRLHGPPGGRGSELIESLALAARRENVTIAFDNPVTGLLSDAEGAVVGAEARAGLERYRIAARKTVLATNGFAADRALLRQYCPDIAGAPYFGATGSQGDAVRWGLELGAALGNMAAYQAHASIADPHGELLTWSIAEKGACFVDREGRRIGNENLGYSGFGAAVMAAGNQAFAVYDQRICEHVAEHQAPYRALVEMGGAREAASLEALAALHGIDAAGLRRTIEEFNAAARGERADPCGRRDFGMAPLEPPFVITRVSAGLFHTQGGLVVDAQAHVLRPDARPIRNLFAGGGAAAGMSGRSGGAGYVSGNGLLSAAVLGYIAGETTGAELSCAKSD